MVKKIQDKSGKDKGFGFMHFATEAAATRILLEPQKPQFKSKLLDVKWRIVSAPGEAMAPRELEDLRVRSIQRHFAKISMMGKGGAPQMMGGPPPGHMMGGPPPMGMPP